MASASVVAAMRAGDAPPKKPWRYYCVMAFQLSNTVSKEKLTGMLELTESIDQREEEYLLKMADREVLHDKEEPISPVARYAAFLLKWLSVALGAFAVAALACVYYIQVTPTGAELDIRVLYGAYAVVTSIVGLNGVIFAGVTLPQARLVQVAAVLLMASICGAVFLLDEMDAIVVSQQALANAIEKPLRAFTIDQIEFILNGGAAPSLWHRFFVDGPSWFLLWLSKHCVDNATVTSSSSATSSDDGESRVDSSDFFSPLWQKDSRSCTRQCLSTHLQLERILRGVVMGLVVAMVTQLVLVLLLLWMGQSEISANDAQGRTAVSRKRKRRRQAKRDQSDDASFFASPVSFTGLARLSFFGLALTGCVLTVASLTLLTSCSFVGPFESWALVLVAVFGVAQIVTAVLANLMWRPRLVKSLLVGGLALESYVASTLTEFCAALTQPLLGKSAGSPSRSSATTTSAMRDAYDTIFQQTCQPMKHWRVHVCVLDAVSSSSGSRSHSPHGVAHAASLFDSPTCQDEFATLLRTTAAHAVGLLSWIMAAQVVVLLWLLLPSMHTLANTVVAAVCCRTSKTNSTPFSMDQKDKTHQQQHLEQHQEKWKHATLDVNEARRLYLTTVKRNDAATMHAEAAAFDTEWAKMTRAAAATGLHSPHKHTDTAVIFTYQFEAIVRTLVLRRLTTNCKLDVNLSVSSDGKRLFAKIFASDNLLMTTLCQCATSYKLQLADAIDPGESFWRNNPREIKMDAKILDAHTVHQKFKLLLLHGVITRKEADIFATESLARVSARVHALLRLHRLANGTLQVAKGGGSSGGRRVAPFVSYAPHTHLQYLYKKYPNRMDTATTAQQRRSAVLRTIDCLRLTRQMLDAEFDLDLMQRNGLLHTLTDLHSASRFDKISNKSLLSSWVAFWTPQHLPGEFELQDNWILNHLGRLSPFRQPLQDVRDYLGECIAFYFAWLALYNQFLLLPTVAIVVLLGVRVLDVSPLVDVVDFCRGINSTTTTTANNDPAVPPSYVMPLSAVALGLAMAAWGTVFAKCWERRSLWYQLEWGMHDRTDLAVADRANFRGVRRRNPATQQMEVYFPSHERFQRQLLSALAILAAGAAHLAVCTLVLLAQSSLSPWIGVRLAVASSSLVLALLILRNGDHVSAICHQLSEWENHQNERDFQRNVITKVCLLQVFNSYGPLFIVAFARDHLHGSSLLAPLPFLSSLWSSWTETFQQRIVTHVGVLVQLEILLLLIFATRITSHVFLMVKGLLRGDASHHSSSSSRAKTTATPPPPSVESELALEVYRGSYEDYTEIVVQLGLVVMFSNVFPIAPALAFVECALEMRLDALDLCLFLQRPTPEIADGIGPWAAAVQAVLKLGTCVSLALLYFMADNYTHWSLVRRVGAFLASVLVAWLASELLWVLMPTQSQEMDEVVARHAFVIDRYFGGEDSSDSTTDGDTHTALSEIERKALAFQEQQDIDDDANDGKQDIDDDANDGNGDDNRTKKQRVYQDQQVDETLAAHYQERLALLHRLNVALRKNDDSLEAELTTAIAPLPPPPPAAVAPPPLVSRYVARKVQPPESAQQQSPPPPPPLPPVADSTPLVIPPASSLPASTLQPLSTTAAAPVTVDQYERKALAGMNAIHTAAERDRFDFGHNTGWQHEARPREPTSSISRRFSLFKNRRKSTDQAEATASSTAAAAPPSASSSSSSSQPGARPTRPVPTLQRRSGEIHGSSTNSRNSSGTLPVVQLSGLDAVREATRRSQFDFSTDPWRENADSSRSL